MDTPLYCPRDHSPLAADDAAGEFICLECNYHERYGLWRQAPVITAATAKQLVKQYRREPRFLCGSCMGRRHGWPCRQTTCECWCKDNTNVEGEAA